MKLVYFMLLNIVVKIKSAHISKEIIKENIVKLNPNIYLLLQV